MELGDIELNTRRYQSGAGGACLRLALGDSNWVILAAFVLGVSTAKLARRPDRYGCRVAKTSMRRGVFHGRHCKPDAQWRGARNTGAGRRRFSLPWCYIWRVEEMIDFWLSARKSAAE